MPTSSTQYNKWFKKVIFAALFLFFLALPLNSQAVLPVTDIGNTAVNVKTSVESTIRNTWDKVWSILKEHSGLLWKQTQVYFGTRLAQDAAIYLASGGKGQSSFIWNVSEIKKLANATAGEYLDNLSKSYFGKSACQPGDLRTMVNIDLSARGLITGISNVRTRVCEEICQRTAVPELVVDKEGNVERTGPNPDAEGAERAGDLAQSGAVNEVGGMLGFRDQFNKIKKDLDAYANSAKDLMKEITKVENEVRLGVGKYVWDNVMYTLYGEDNIKAGLLSSIVVNQDGGKLGDVTSIVFTDGGSITTPQKLKEEDPLAWQMDFNTALKGGLEIFYQPETGGETSVTLQGHGEPFANLVTDIFVRFYNKYPQAKEDKVYPWGPKDLDNFFKGNSVTAGLGLEALAKLVPASLISFTFQNKYVSTDERQALLGDMFLELYASEMGDIYKLFAANEELIKRKALLARPPTLPDIQPILELVQAYIKSGLPSSVKQTLTSIITPGPGGSFLDPLDTLRTYPTNLSVTITNPLVKEKNGVWLVDYLAELAGTIIGQKKVIDDKYPDLKQFTEAFQKFNQCVQACESAKLKEPKGTCTLDKITNGPGALGVTGLTGGVQVNVEGSQVYSAYSSEAIGKGDDAYQEVLDERDARAEKNLPDFTDTKRKRWLVQDLEAFSQIGFPEQNPIGQILDIALRSQGQSEEARRQAEVEAQAKDFKPKKSLISGDVKVTSDMNAGRLNNALADVRAANNEYTDSVLAQMWGVFFNTLLEEFQKKLFDKGLDPKLYGGAFNPITRQAFGKGVAAAEKQLGQVFKPNITPGGVITAQILTNLTSGCEKPASKKRFDECIIDESFKQAIEQRLTLAKATCFNIKDCTPFISGNGAFGFLSAGTEPQIQYGSGGAADSGQGIPYKSMIVLRKYRIIPASWEVAAVWVRDVALKSADGKPAPGKVTLNDVMAGFDDKTSAYYGLVNPNWVLKLPQYQCNRQGAGEETITETPSENPSVTNTDPFDVQITRADNYCADPASCIREKPDGTGCAEFGYCTEERDFWRFPSATCQEINKTCQAYTAPNPPRAENGGQAAPNGKTVAYLEQSLDINGECSESSDGCTGFIRDYNYGRFIGEISSRGDGKSDTAFIWSPNIFTSAAKIALPGLVSKLNNDTDFDDPERAWLPDPSLYPNNSTVNTTGFVDAVPAAFQCESLGRTCTYEQIAGRAEGCVLPKTNGVQCKPWKTETSPKGVAVLAPANSITDVSADQRYWCGLPGGAGCFVGTTGVIDGSLETTRNIEPPSHTTIIKQEGKSCALGRWDYNNNGEYVFVPLLGGTDGQTKLTCSLYRSSEDAQPGTKRVYLNDNARPCSASAAGCQQYYTVDFGRDEYTREFEDSPDTTDKDERDQSYATFLTLEEKKDFVKNLANRVFPFYKDTLFGSQRESFDYARDIPLAEIIPISLKFTDSKIEFAREPKITPISLNANREYCTEREVACRRYTMKGGGTVAAIINPRENQCPNECVGFERYREPLSVIEKKLGSRAIVTEPLTNIDRYLISSDGFECPNQSADAGCESFIKSDNENNVIRMYLKDIRLCVNPDHKKDDGSKANAVYTIIESSASGATRPVNVELLQSDLKDKIYYIYYTTDNQGKKRVKVFNTDNDQDVDGDPDTSNKVSPLYGVKYNGPCTFMDPGKNQGKPVDRWQCNDRFDDIKPHLERCLILNDDGQAVTDLTNPDCREYIYFPPEGVGAERYPIPEDAPIYASPTCDVLKRGSPDGLAYPIDPQSPILGRFTCSEAAVSCREYQGPGFQTNGPLALDFEGTETRWVDDGIPEKAVNVNGEEDEAILFEADDADKIYYFDILFIPKDPSTAQVYEGKSFVLTFWGKGSGDVKIALGSGTYDTEGKFTPTSKEISYFTLGAIIGEWRSQISPQLSPVDGDQKSFLPTHLVITVPSNGSLTLDNITLEMSTSVYLLRNSIEPSGEDGWNTPKSCNTDFNQNEPIYYEKGKDKDGNDVHPQLGCRAYTSDRDEPLAFKSYGLCRDEAVGCVPVINTFNTRSPEGETFVPRGEALTDEERPENTYIVPPDFLEYIVVPNDPNASVFCKGESARGGSAFGGEVGCTLLGKETRDQTGKVIGFTETARIDDPGSYSQGASSIACLVSENSCRLYKRIENESPARFKEPGTRACEWLSDEQSPIKQRGWFRKIVDADGNITDDYETCELAYEMLDSSIDYKIPRAKGYCLEKSTGRSVLNPTGATTQWCDISLIGKDLVIEEAKSKKESEKQHTNSLSTCLDYIDVPNVDEGGSLDPNKVNAGVNEAQVVCAPTPMSCDPKESQCTWYKDPLGEGLGKHYFQIRVDKNEAEGDCDGRVGDDAGCRLFEDTSVIPTSDAPKLKYNAAAGKAGGTLDAALMCKNVADDDKNADDIDNPNDCDTNQLIEVERDRACGEWLACSSAIVTGKENETVCVERKPCNIAGGGECVNFVQDAKQSFESKELGDKSARDRVSRLSGYSNVGYRWSWCDPYSSDSIVSTDKKKTQCFSGRECVNELLLYKKPDTGVSCDVDRQVNTLDACKESVCQEGAYKGNSCVNDKDCYSDDELLIQVKENNVDVCVDTVASFCNSSGMVVSKSGFKSFDEIREVGAHADVVNGNFEDVLVEVVESEAGTSQQITSGGLQSLVSVFPAGWDVASCGNGCGLLKRYNPANTQGSRSDAVKNGKYSFQINSINKFADQIIENILPNTTYSISAWITSEGGKTPSGIEVAEFRFDDKISAVCDLKNPGSSLDHCLSVLKTDGWEDFSTTFTTNIATTKLRIRLRNTDTSQIIFDDIQLRAHLRLSDESLIAPSCRIYPDTRSLTCDSRNEQGSRIRGWRGYCIENDPRADTNDPRKGAVQCLNWWPTDIIQGETNVLGPIEDFGYNGKAPLYYCAETMDKDPGVPLPRLVCLAKNDVSGEGANTAFEACKILALVSDPKPAFYTLSTDDWRLGVDANDFGEDSEERGGPGDNKVRMILGFDDRSNYNDREMLTLNTSGLCFIDEKNHFLGDGDDTDCMNGCFLVEGLGGWGEGKKNYGVKVFFKKGTEKQVNYGGCTWSQTGGNWTECARDIETYYHKIAYFWFNNADGSNEMNQPDEHKAEAGCWPHDKGDRVYELVNNSSFTNKSAEPNTHPVTSDVLDIIKNNTRWYYNSANLGHPTNDAKDLDGLAQILIDDEKKKDDPIYYIYDNFESVTRGRLNSYTQTITPQEGRRFFANNYIPRQARPQQCSVIVQTVDVSGKNKAWAEKTEKGGEPLPAPLGYQKSDPLCDPYGAAPYVRSPQSIVLQPIERASGKVLPRRKVPLELYHPENIENKDESLVCREAHRGGGFYSCGGICNTCSNTENFCVSDDDCNDGIGSEGVCNQVISGESGIVGKKVEQCSIVEENCYDASESCRDDAAGEVKGGCDDNGALCKDDKVCFFEDTPAENDSCKTKDGSVCKEKDDDTGDYRHFTVNISGSGMRRLQDVFAKIFKVFEWRFGKDSSDKKVSKDAEDIKKRTGIDIGEYKELNVMELDAKFSTSPEGLKWKDASDISYLPKVCGSLGSSDACKAFPGCRFGDVCVPRGDPFNATRGEQPNDYRDYDYCAKQDDSCGQTPYCQSNTAQLSCVPYTNQYPDVADIKVNEEDGGVVTIGEGGRNVKLAFTIDAVADQKPIKTIVVDWGDGSQTALSGIAWKEGARAFQHTYTYYPEDPAISGSPVDEEAPATCGYYADAKKYECRFRPRVKAVDNWGWCNGSKLFFDANGNGKFDYDKDAEIITDSDSENLKLDRAYTTVDISIQYKADGLQKEDDGLDWGYYGASCFTPPVPEETPKMCSQSTEGGFCSNDSKKYCDENGDCGQGNTCDFGKKAGDACTNNLECLNGMCVPSNGGDARIAMQSWDYFPGVITVLPPSERTGTDNPPTAQIYFIRSSDYTDITKDLLDDGELTGKPLVSEEPLAVTVVCEDGYGISSCRLIEITTTSKLTCFNTINKALKDQCVGGRYCSAFAACQFDVPGTWDFSLEAFDDRGKKNADLTYPKIVVGGSGIAVTLEVAPPGGEFKNITYYDESSKEKKLKSGEGYGVKLTCADNSKGNITECRLVPKGIVELSCKGEPLGCKKGGADGFYDCGSKTSFTFKNTPNCSLQGDAGSPFPQTWQPFVSAKSDSGAVATQSFEAKVYSDSGQAPTVKFTVNDEKIVDSIAMVKDWQYKLGLLCDQTNGSLTKCFIEDPSSVLGSCSLTKFVKQESSYIVQDCSGQSCNGAISCKIIGDKGESYIVRASASNDDLTPMERKEEIQIKVGSNVDVPQYNALLVKPSGVLDGEYISINEYKGDSDDHKLYYSTQYDMKLVCSSNTSKEGQAGDSVTKCLLDDDDNPYRPTISCAADLGCDGNCGGTQVYEKETAGCSFTGDDKSQGWSAAVYKRDAEGFRSQDIFGLNGLPIFRKP